MRYMAVCKMETYYVRDTHTHKFKTIPMQED